MHYSRQVEIINTLLKVSCLGKQLSKNRATVMFFVEHIYLTLKLLCTLHIRNLKWMSFIDQ